MSVLFSISTSYNATQDPECDIRFLTLTKYILRFSYTCLVLHFTLSTILTAICNCKYYAILSN